MLIDDSEVARLVARDALEQRGYRVVDLDTPFELTGRFAHVKPDVVLVDVMMPAVHGDTFVTVVRKHALLDCPIVLYSERPPEELRRLAAACGADGWIAKSDDLGELVDAVDRMLRDRIAPGTP
jgi:CheY-like chemotaxis protein